MGIIVKKLIAALALFSVLIAPATGKSLRGAPVSAFLNATSPLGINLAPGNDNPFLNALWNSVGNGWGNGSSGINGHLSDLQLDSNGWPMSSFRGGSGTTYTDGLGFPLQVRPFDTNLTVFCAGTATVNLQGAGNVNVSCPSTGGTAITLAGIFTGTITNDDQTTNGNHLTALAVVPTVYATQFANAGCLTNQAQAACISPDFIAIDAPFRWFRFMDYEAANTNTQTTNWASRPLPGAPFYICCAGQTYFGGAVIPIGLPPEFEAALCNALNASCYLNFPINATDDYAVGLSEFMSANVNQYVYYEYVNEPWNTGTGIPGLLEAKGATAFGTSATFLAGMSYYEMQADHLMGLVTSNSSNTRYFRVLGLGPNQNTQGTGANWWWFGGPAQGNLWSGWTLAHFDAGVLAPYFIGAVPDAWGAPSLLGNLFTEIQSAEIIPSTSAANTTTGSGNNYVLTSSSLCGNGAIPATPTNGTITCFKPNIANTGSSTLKVDGGTQFPLYLVQSASNNITSFQLSSGLLATGTGYNAVFTTTTGAPSWSSSVTYSAGFPVVASDGNTYFSIAGSNTNINPVGDGGVHWQALTPAWWLCLGCGGSNGGLINSAMKDITDTTATMASLSVSMPLVCYESGQSIVNIGDTFTLYTMNEAQADSRWLSVYAQYYAAIKANGETGTCGHYNDIGTSIFGAWGFNSEMYTSTGIAPVIPKQQSLYNYIQANPKVSLP